VFCFLVLEEESAALTHHLPVGYAAAPILASAFGMRCKLVEADSTSRTKNFDLLKKRAMTAENANANSDLPLLGFCNDMLLGSKYAAR
jgi:hypothetical protein